MAAGTATCRHGKPAWTGCRQRHNRTANGPAGRPDAARHAAHGPNSDARRTPIRGPKRANKALGHGPAKG